jgi:predicted Zn-dependent peptidase
VRAGLMRLVSDNSGMAQVLATTDVLEGDWRNLFKVLDKINAVTPQDVQRVAKATFSDNGRTVGFLEPLQQAKAQ